MHLLFSSEKFLGGALEAVSAPTVHIEAVEQRKPSIQLPVLKRSSPAKEALIRGVLDMFDCVYTGPGAKPLQVSDLSMTASQKHKLVVDLNWNSLEENSKTSFLTSLKKFKVWSDANPDQPYKYIVWPMSKVSAFFQSILDTQTAKGSKNPNETVRSAKKALKHLQACQEGVPEMTLADDYALVKAVQTNARLASAEIRSSNTTDPAHSQYVLSATEMKTVLTAALTHHDPKVGLLAACMVSVGTATGLRGDDLADMRYFLELAEPITSCPDVMQVLSIALNGGKGNKDNLICFAGFAQHKDPFLDPSFFMANQMIYNLLVDGSPIVQLIKAGDFTWRDYRLLACDKNTALQKQTYYSLCKAFLEVIQTLDDNSMFKKKILHLFRITGAVLLSAGGCTPDEVRTWGRWDGSGTERRHYLPRSPLSAAAGIAVAAGFTGDYMRTHSLPRGSVVVPNSWVEALAPDVLEAQRVVSERNKLGAQRDFSGLNTLHGIQALVEGFWQCVPFHLPRLGNAFWAMRLPAFREIILSEAYAVFAKQVMKAHSDSLAAVADPVLGAIYKEVQVMGEKVDVIYQAVSSPAPESQAEASGLKRKREEPPLPFVHYSGLFSNSVSTVAGAVTEFFEGVNGFPSVLSVKAAAALKKEKFDSNCRSLYSQRRHLPQRIEIICAEREWPLERGIAAFQLLEHAPYSLSLCEIRQGVRLCPNLMVADSGARGSRKRTAVQINRSPGLEAVSIQKFQGWVAECLLKV